MRLPPTSDRHSAKLDARGDVRSARAGWRGHGKREMWMTQKSKFDNNGQEKGDQCGSCRDGVSLVLYKTRNPSPRCARPRSS